MSDVPPGCAPRLSTIAAIAALALAIIRPRRHHVG